MNENSYTLITGATGFVGSHVARLLSSQNRPLKLLLRPGSSRVNLEGVRYEDCPGDLRDIPSIEKAMKDVDIVHHVAAKFSFWAENKQDFYDINVTGTKNMCEAALKARIKRFVYTSTTGAVGISYDGKPLNEDSPWNRNWSTDPYTLSKYAAEQVVLDYVKKGLPAVILNPTGPIGPGDLYAPGAGKIICDFANGKIPAVVDGNFSIVDVRDVAKAHFLAEEKGKVGERYLLCAKNVTSLWLLETLGKILNRKPPKIKIPVWLVIAMAPLLTWVADHITHKAPMVTPPVAKLLPYYFWFDGSKAARELGFDYSSVEKALEDAVIWFRKNGMIKK